MSTPKRNMVREVPGSWRRIIDECIAKALGDAFRQQIVWILNERVASPTEIAKELGASLNRVCHHISVLMDANCIELAYVMPVGNRLQHFYRATSRAFLDSADWPCVPDSVKGSMRATLLRNVLNDAIDAVDKGTYDAAPGAHMSWTPMLLDDQGFSEISKILEDALLAALEVQEDTKRRLLDCDAVGESYTVSILGYQAVGGAKRVGPPVGAEALLPSDDHPGGPVEAPSRQAGGKRRAPTKPRKATAKPKAKRKKK